MDDAPKALTTVREYADLVEALRARRDALQITHETIDDIAGLSSGYAGKLLCNPPLRRLASMLGPMLGALGLKLLVVEDPEAMVRVERRISRKDYYRRVHQAPLEPRRRRPQKAPPPCEAPPLAARSPRSGTAAPAAAAV